MFVLAVMYTLLHHGVLGTFAPEEVFAAHAGNPWGWAAIHAVFVAAAGAAGVVAWRLNEDVRHRMRETQEELRDAAMTDSLTGLANRRRLMDDLEAAVEDAAGAPRAVRPRRLQGLQRHLRPPGRRCPAHAPRPPAERGRGRRGAAPTGSAATSSACWRPAPRAPRRSRPPGRRSPSTGSVRDRQLARRGAPRRERPTSPRTRCASPTSACTSGRTAAAGRPATRARPCSCARCPSGTRSSARTAPTSRRWPSWSPASSTWPRTSWSRSAMRPSCTTSARSASRTRSSPSRAGSTPRSGRFMRRHTIIGERIIAGAPALAQVGRLVRSSHERWDGTGYPDELGGEEIPIGSRIIAVCDAFDAMAPSVPTRPRSQHERRTRRAAPLRRHAVRPRRGRGVLRGAGRGARRSSPRAGRRARPRLIARRSPQGLSFRPSCRR